MNTVERFACQLKYKLGLKDFSPLTCTIRPHYDRFLEVLYGRRGLIRRMDGQESIRILPSQRYFREDFEGDLFRYLRETVKEGDEILEVGANVGIFTVLLARWTGLRGRVHAFEPTPRARKTLQTHLMLNHVAERVTIIPEAVSDSPGRAAFFTVGTSGENTLSPKHARIPSAERIEVQVTTIDAYCKKYKIVPSLIKIDIEGYEFHALRGARQTIERYAPNIVVELHPMNWPDIGMNAESARQFVSDLNYSAKPLQGNQDPFTSYGHLILEPRRKREVGSCNAENAGNKELFELPSTETART